MSDLQNEFDQSSGFRVVMVCHDSEEEGRKFAADNEGVEFLGMRKRKNYTDWRLHVQDAQFEAVKAKLVDRNLSFEAHRPAAPELL